MPPPVNPFDKRIIDEAQVAELRAAAQLQLDATRADITRKLDLVLAHIREHAEVYLLALGEISRDELVTALQVEARHALDQLR